MGAFTLAGLLYLGAAIVVLPVVGRVRPTRQAVVRGAPRLATAVMLAERLAQFCSPPGSATRAATASLLLNLEFVFTTVLAYFVFRSTSALASSPAPC